MTSGLNLGAPGVYRSPGRMEFGSAPIRLDVAGFVGLAPRGPVNVPTRVDSWTDYQLTFGGFDAPEGIEAQARLPYAVEAFFAQGGVRAYIVRVAPAGPHTGPDEAADAATARFRLGPWQLTAANEGAWGNTLTIRLDFDVAQPMSIESDDGGLPLPPGADVPIGSVVRLRNSALPAGGVLRRVVQRRPNASGPDTAVLDEPVPAGVVLDCDVVTGTLYIDDGDETLERAEVFRNLGLHPDHPRFVYRIIAPAPSDLPSEPDQVPSSRLIRPVGVWGEPITPTAQLSPALGALVSSGRDRWGGIDFDSFVDESADADPLDEWDRHRGVDAMGRQSDIGLLCVPDLDWEWRGPQSAPKAWPPRVRTSGEFETCAPADEIIATAAPIAQSRLDPRNPDQLAAITRRQQRVVDVAELRHRFVALLDVPNGISTPAVLRWRGGFASSFAAAYHPWLGTPREGDPARTLVDVPPSAFAAGIIAARERRLGLPWGPANELAIGAVTAATVSDPVHDQLHLADINVFRVERDGFRLSAARTLSTDADYRQLSVRRLMTMLRLTLERQGQWLVFEPNSAAVRRALTLSITQLLRGMQRAGAFAGTTDADSFFVKCDDTLNPRVSQELGRLVAEVGVAPAAPLEYLVLRLTQDSSGRVQVSDRGGGNPV